jgi:hypothetical protein
MRHKKNSGFLVVLRMHLEPTVKPSHADHFLIGDSNCVLLTREADPLAGDV